MRPDNSESRKRALVTVVDDDESIRESLTDLLDQFGYAVHAFPSAEALLCSDVVSQTRCLILDIGMPGMTGPELRRDLERRGLAVPIIFITAHKDETTRAQMIADGAVECLFKPFSDSVLLHALQKALPDG